MVFGVKHVGLNIACMALSRGQTQMIKCILPKNHNTVHLSQIVGEDELFKWRIYWNDRDWGSYICDEKGQVFDFWKGDHPVGEISNAKGIESHARCKSNYKLGVPPRHS